MENLLTEENLRRLIQERAYEIYQARGQSEGSPLADWDRAENEILTSLIEVGPLESAVSLVQVEDTALNLAKQKRAKGARA